MQLEFEIARFNVTNLKLSVESLDVSDKEFEEMTGERPQGNKQSRRCKGLNLADNERDSAHIYWNHTTKNFSVWSL